MNHEIDQLMFVKINDFTIKCISHIFPKRAFAKIAQCIKLNNIFYFVRDIVSTFEVFEVLYGPKVRKWSLF